MFTSTQVTVGVIRLRGDASAAAGATERDDQRDDHDHGAGPGRTADVAEGRG